MANLSHLPQAWRESGLSQRAFCKREGISLATFSYWRRKELRGAADAPAAPAPAFTEVVVEPRLNVAPASTSSIEVTFPDGTRVRIPVPASSSAPAC